MPYDFMYVEKQKVQLTNAELKSIGKLYEQWAKDIEKEWGNKITNSAPAVEKKTQMLKLRSSLRREAKYIAGQVERQIKESIYIMSNDVVDAMYANLSDLGVNSKLLRASFSSIPTNIVENLASGAIYGGQSNWNLSKAIWGDSNQTLSQMYKIVAGGIAQNKSIYEIANELSKYVNPNAAKQWNLKTKDGVRIYPKKVDYAAQRLARTLSQHAYQQTIVQTTLKNPMVLGIRWRANGSRVCEVCKARDGQVFPKDQLPLDHPNGMCVMEPIYLADSDNMIAKWVNSPAGTYPSMDSWAKELGYEFDGNNPSTPIANIMRNEDNKSVAKQSYKNDQPFDSRTWTDYEETKEFDNMLREFRDKQNEYQGSKKVFIDTVDNYTREGYYDKLNAHLRGENILERYPEDFRNEVLDLDKKLEDIMKNSVIPEGVKVQREGRLGEFANVLGVSEDDLKKAYKDEGFMKELSDRLSGQTIRVKNYMSTHTKWGRFSNHEYQWYINVSNNDTHGLYMTEYHHYGSGENEILFDKNVDFVIKKIERVNDGGYIKNRVYIETI